MAIERKLLPSGKLPERIQEIGILPRPKVLDPFHPNLMLLGWEYMEEEIEAHARSLNLPLKGFTDADILAMGQRTSEIKTEFVASVNTLSRFLLTDDDYGIPEGLKVRFSMNEQKHYVFSYREKIKGTTVPFVEIEIDPRNISGTEPVRKISQAITRMSVFHMVSFPIETRFGGATRTSKKDMMYESIWYENNPMSRVIAYDFVGSTSFDLSIKSRLEKASYDNWNPEVK